MLPFQLFRDVQLKTCGRLMRLLQYLWQKEFEGINEIKKATSNSLFFIAESTIDCFHFDFWIA